MRKKISAATVATGGWRKRGSLGMITNIIRSAVGL
jgi:hypothetical protein